VSYFLVLQTGHDNKVIHPAISLAWAVLALALFLLWQFLTVHYNRAGNWTALFLTGQESAIPPDLAPGTYKFPGVGYDGEMYRYVAHDIFARRGYVQYVDSPAQRYRRILVPTLAYLLVAGHQPWIDASYIAVIAIFVLLGAYWLSRLAVLAGRHPAWALAFLAVPATLISMDRMTVDVALVAFTVAFAFYWRTGAWVKVFIVLTLACLVRETGVVLAGACCLLELFSRRFARAALWASTALPILVWYLIVRRTLPQHTNIIVPHWFTIGFPPGIFETLLQPPRYPLSPVLESIARWGDVISLTAILLASIVAILLLRSRPLNPMVIAAILFAVMVFALTNPRYWYDINGYARVVSPLLLLVGLGTVAGEGRVRWWIGLVPAILVDLRLSMEFAGAAGGIVRGLLAR
jgi:energy-converting hydrogenase Eha subunit C